MTPFPLGRVVATPGALELLEQTGEDPLRHLVRHASGDWGDLDAHDRRENERSMRHGWRILSSYPVGEKTIWIITEADRSITTILLPEEYQLKTYDYIHYYRGYWSDGGKCRIRIYREERQNAVVICSQLPENKNTSVTNMVEYLAAEVIEEHGLATPLTWIEYYPEHRGKLGEYSLVRFSCWERREVYLGGVWRCQVGLPNWSPLQSEEVGALLVGRETTTT